MNDWPKTSYLTPFRPRTKIELNVLSFLVHPGKPDKETTPVERCNGMKVIEDPQANTILWRGFFIAA